MYQPRTPVENPYCQRQLPSDEPASPWHPEWTFLGRRGVCGGCGRIVDLRTNGTAKLHKVYGRRDMARRIAEYKRSGTL